MLTPQNNNNVPSRPPVPGPPPGVQTAGCTGARVSLGRRDGGGWDGVPLTVALVPGRFLLRTAVSSAMTMSVSPLRFGGGISRDYRNSADDVEVNLARLLEQRGCGG